MSSGFAKSISQYEYWKDPNIDYWLFEYDNFPIGLIVYLTVNNDIGYQLVNKGIDHMIFDDTPDDNSNTQPAMCTGTWTCTSYSEWNNATSLAYNEEVLGTGYQGTAESDCIAFCNGNHESATTGCGGNYCDTGGAEPQFFCAWNCGEGSTWGQAGMCHERSAGGGPTGGADWGNAEEMNHSCEDAWEFNGICPPGCTYIDAVIDAVDEILYLIKISKNLSLVEL